MTMEQYFLFAIVAAGLVMFAWGRLRYDVVAVLLLLASVASGVVATDHAFSGFGHPAVVTVAAILVLSRALRKSQIVETISRFLEPATKSTSLHVLAMSGTAAACSAFMNNVGALALMLPVAIRSAKETRRPVSRFLMPLSFGSLLGGLITLIGTPPNIIIASVRAEATGTTFAMFDFAPVGLGVAVVGVVFIALIGWRLLPRRGDVTDPQARFMLEDYMTELRVHNGSRFVGRRLVDLEALGQGDLVVVALIRRDDRMLAPSGFLRLQAEDILVVEADTATLERIAEKAELEVEGSAEVETEHLRSERVGLMEAVIVPGSRLEARTAQGMRLHTRYGVNLLGVARQGRAVGERLGQVRFRAGDVLLLQGERASMQDALTNLGCLPLAQREIGLGRPKGSPVPALIFGSAIALVVSGTVPAQIAFVAAAVALVILQQVSLRELYESIDWSVIVLLGAMIPIGSALESTGGTMVIAGPILTLAHQVPLWAVLALLMIVTMLISDIMNNAATAVLMAPIGIAIGHGLDVSIDPFLMAVAVGASSTYLTPIGHQSNLLVMGPGGYKFGDYWRMGLPLDILIVSVAVPLILVVWPF
ncbi:SLC13 family permease [Denitrobaculum tricleocarpae]|uniref:SLC13 family permease n=1 Tax=Denitrobaculum tricleocarpae TaxID=2591009 RepID=A0A545TWZ8_9PROT|nr:SLC13 family permease [Denitrobaculum tricleocarpae]TQV81752.1 SLC13 family permease [Denitrobaculum tricleocarpae]